jgi:hypothetical protein
MCVCVCVCVAKADYSGKRAMFTYANNNDIETQTNKEELLRWKS